MSDSPSWTVFESGLDEWQSKLPENFTESFDWLLAWPQSKVIELLAFAMSHSVNGLQTRDGKSDMDALVKVLGVDMNQYWEPTQAAYFDHINKNGIVSVITEVVSADKAPPLAAMKKVEAAAAAERLVSGTGWLPLTLREAVESVDDEVAE